MKRALPIHRECSSTISSSIPFTDRPFCNSPLPPPSRSWPFFPTCSTQLKVAPITPASRSRAIQRRWWLPGSGRPGPIPNVPDLVEALTVLSMVSNGRPRDNQVEGFTAISVPQTPQLQIPRPPPEIGCPVPPVFDRCRSWLAGLLRKLVDLPYASILLGGVHDWLEAVERSPMVQTYG